MHIRLSLALWLLPLLASAQTRFVNMPICVPPLATPVQSLRIYGDSTLLKDVAMWSPLGAIRTGIYIACPVPAAVLSTALVRDGKELPRAQTLLQSPATPCWTAPSASVGTPLKCSDLPGKNEWLANLRSDCLSDPACGQFLMDSCLKDANCSTALTVHTSVDYNQDGVVDASDAAWIAAAIRNAIP